MFEIDIEHCLNCGGELKIIAAIRERAVIERILTHLGASADLGRDRDQARLQGKVGSRMAFGFPMR